MASEALLNLFVKNKSISSIMHINARSVAGKMPELRILLTHLPVDVLAITETRLTEETEYLLIIPGSKTICNSGKDRIGGGVAILLREEIAYYQLSSINDLIHTSYEGAFIGIPQQKGQDIMVGVHYRPSGQPLETFNEELSKMIPILIKEKRRVMIIGDFNIDLLKSTNHESSQHFSNIMTSAYFAPTINCQTRVTDSTATLIDNIFTNFSQEIINPSVIVTSRTIFLSLSGLETQSHLRNRILEIPL